MPINKPIIASQGTRTREQAKTVVFRVSSTIPPDFRVWVPPGGVPEVQEQTPDREGMVILYQVRPGEEITVYVVVEIGGELVWKTAAVGIDYIDYRTGQSWDPLANAYSYLVPYEP